MGVSSDRSPLPFIDGTDGVGMGLLSNREQRQVYQCKIDKLNKFCPQILTNTGKWSCGHKLQPDGLALALQDSRLGQSPQEATILAQLGLAWLMA